MASPGSLFRVVARGDGVALPPDPVFAVAPSAYEARSLLAQVLHLSPTALRMQLCPPDTRPPRDALVYRLEPGSRPLGERWVLYRGLTATPGNLRPRGLSSARP